MAGVFVHCELLTREILHIQPSLAPTLRALRVYLQMYRQI